MLSRESSATLMNAVTAFIYKEARLQDEHQYDAWEALWTDDGVYWVPGQRRRHRSREGNVDHLRQPLAHRAAHQAIADRQALHPDAAVAAAAAGVEYRTAGPA